MARMARDDQRETTTTTHDKAKDLSLLGKTCWAMMPKGARVAAAAAAVAVADSQASKPASETN